MYQSRARGVVHLAGVDAGLLEQLIPLGLALVAGMLCRFDVGGRRVESQMPNMLPCHQSLRDEQWMSTQCE